MCFSQGRSTENPVSRKTSGTGKQTTQTNQEVLDKDNFLAQFVLKLKRGEKEAVYRTNPRNIQTFWEEVLEGIPNAMHNSVLHYVYKTMCDVYGVPIDTYRNEYFADTGKRSQNSLEIAHWLEFRNPAICGLLIFIIRRRGTMSEKLKKQAVFWEKAIRNMAVLMAILFFLAGDELAVRFLLLWIPLVFIRFAYFVWQCLKDL